MDILTVPHMAIVRQQLVLLLVMCLIQTYTVARCHLYHQHVEHLQLLQSMEEITHFRRLVVQAHSHSLVAVQSIQLVVMVELLALFLHHSILKNHDFIMMMGITLMFLHQITLHYRTSQLAEESILKGLHHDEVQCHKHKADISKCGES